MIKILFVCHGNICRSPMAEFVMKKLVCDMGIEEKFEIASAATSSEEIGNPVYPPVKRILDSIGIDSSGKRARRIKASDYDYYDYLIGMDSANIRNMKHLFGGDKDNKIHLLLSFAGLNRDISDPWYTDDFETCYEDIIKGVTSLIRRIENA